MATNNVKYQCGCGYSTKKVEEAVQHVEKQQHTMFATGEIQKNPK